MMWCIQDSTPSTYFLRRPIPGIVEPTQETIAYMWLCGKVNCSLFVLCGPFGKWAIGHGFTCRAPKGLCLPKTARKHFDSSNLLPPTCMSKSAPVAKRCYHRGLITRKAACKVCENGPPPNCIARSNDGSAAVVDTLANQASCRRRETGAVRIDGDASRGCPSSSLSGSVG